MTRDTARDQWFAHSTDGPPDTWEPLDRHLRDVAETAESFAARFGAGEWARLAGLWHDLGKYAPAFQDYLRTTAGLAEDDPRRRSLRGTVDHSTAGALLARERLGPASCLLTYVIAGHHAGLPDDIGDDALRSSLSERLESPRPESRQALEHAPASMIDQIGPARIPPLTVGPGRRNRGFALAFLVRMIFSALVDADYLATERFLDPARAARRPEPPPPMSDLAARLDDFLAGLRAASASAESVVNTQRARVLRACLDAAARKPGHFALTVPTGGGKTLSSLAFALHHADRHDLDRVIVAIPYTSIIEQNADVIRRALRAPSHVVLEHHSNLDERADEHDDGRRRLAAENWDAPVVVTTNVQLFESLFASRTRRARKVHRMARSVIILDEAQTLPPDLLAPTLAALRELVTNYGCSIVLCTATQPALERREAFPIGLDAPHQIIPVPERRDMFDALRRVEVERGGVIADADLVDRLAAESQALCIVNTTGHAAALFATLAERLGEDATVDADEDRTRARPDETCFHLSARMCPRHRSIVLWLIKRRLAAGRPCRVVSTQVVEAGVDVDFPVVYRALAGLDSIAQAAGRCNREGKRRDLGRVVVFERDAGEERRPPGFVRTPIEVAREVWADGVDPLAPETQEAYSSLYYWQRRAGSDDWDRAPGVLPCFDSRTASFRFRTAAERYRLIEDERIAVVVPFGRRGRRLVETLRTSEDPPGRAFDRRLQRFVVGLREREIDTLIGNACLIPPDTTHGRWVLDSSKAYDRRLGVRFDAAGLEAEGLIT